VGTGFPRDKREALVREIMPGQAGRPAVLLGLAIGAVVYVGQSKEHPMKILSAAAVIAMLAGPAYAQGPNVNLMPDLPSKTAEEKEADAIKDKAYKESLRKIPAAQGSSDPWGNVRSAETPKSVAPAKPRTKTGSAAN
jgi:hypothetical protein